MIDPRLLRDDPDRVRAAQAKRGLSADVVDRALAADAARRQRHRRLRGQACRAEGERRPVAKAQGEEKQALLAQVKELAAGVKAAEAARNEAEAEWDEAIKAIPNVAADEAPAGGEDDFVGARARRHAARVRLRAARPHRARQDARRHRPRARRQGVSGSRFYFLTGIGAQLELALVNMAMDQARDAGFTQVIAPSLVKPRAMEGTGFLGQAADDVYRIEGEDLYLVGTSEVAMAAYHSDEILDAAVAAARYAAFSPCFRKEAGSHGKDTKGIIRVHWFDKVEMFVYTTRRGVVRRARAAAGLGEGVPRQARGSPTGSSTSPPATSGLSAQRKFDCEVWIPTQGKFRELTSTSNCTDFQSRRLDIRTRDATARPCRSRPSTARSPRSPAPSWRSWRPTRTRTARSPCRRPCAPTSAAWKC